LAEGEIASVRRVLSQKLPARAVRQSLDLVGSIGGLLVEVEQDAVPPGGERDARAVGRPGGGDVVLRDGVDERNGDTASRRWR
jgi:hypothetical protein